MSGTGASPPRCVVIGTGFVGAALTRLILQRGWPIVAAYNRGGSKIGRDLGVVAGLDRPLGVVVEDLDLADFGTIAADVALIATTDRLATNFPLYARCFAAGWNVLCHGTESYHPAWIAPDMAGRIDALAVAGGVTFTGGGIWDSTRVWSGILAAGPTIELKAMVHRTQTDALRQGIYWAERLGIGLEPEAFSALMAPHVSAWGRQVQVPSVMVAQALGYTVARVENGLEPVLRAHDVWCQPLERTIPAGTALGVRFLVDLATEEGPIFQTRYEARAFAADETEVMHWMVDGLPGADLSFVREDSGIASAASLLNRVPDVLAARPGVVTITEYGPLLGSRGLRGRRQGQ